jgi:hypothetical protein
MMTTEPLSRDEPLIASLAALTDARPGSLAQSSPRQLLSRVEPGWSDDLIAWGLVQRFVGLARRRLRQLQGSSDSAAAAAEARARWAYGVALDLYEELRMRALSVESNELNRTDRSSFGE